MRPPPSTACPPGPGPPGRPSAAAGERRKGTREGLRGAPPSCPSPLLPPLSPPGPRTAGGRPRRWRPRSPPAGPGGGPPRPGGPQHRGGDATAAASTAVRGVPPVGRRPTPAVPAAGRQPCAGAQGRPVGRSGTAAPGREPKQTITLTWRAGHRRSDPPWCPPGEGGETDRSKETFPPPTPGGPRAEPPRGDGAPTPPPPARLTHRQPARPRPASGAAKLPRPNTYTWEGCAGEEGGSGPGTTGHPPGGGRWGTTARPPLPSPATPPSGPRDAGNGPRGRRASTPPKAGGTSPLPPKEPRRPEGGTLLSPYATRPHAPPRLLA